MRTVKIKLERISWGLPLNSIPLSVGVRPEREFSFAQNKYVNVWIWFITAVIIEGHSTTIAEGIWSENSYIYILHLLRSLNIHGLDMIRLISPVMGPTVLPLLSRQDGKNSSCLMCDRIVPFGRKTYCSRVCKYHGKYWINFIISKRARNANSR